MSRLTDQELVAAFQERLEFNRRALADLRAVTGKLEATNRKLQESEALKGQFLSNIRNEINNPLAAIMGLAGLLLGTDVDAGRRKDLARLVYAEAFALDFQLENIFVAAELEAGEGAPDLARVDVVGIVDGVLEQLPFLQGDKALVIRRELPQGLVTVTDARKLHVIVLNLLANAVEFSFDGGEVTVAVESRNGVLEVSVRDQGPGIDPEAREAVFDRFRQLDAGSAKGHRGHGLGLSVSRALVELLGGTLRLESAAGEGSSFTVSIPEQHGEATDLAGGGNVFLFDGAELF